MLRIVRSVPVALAFLVLMATTALADIQAFDITGATLVNPAQVEVTGVITCPVGEFFYVCADVQQSRHTQVYGSGCSSLYTDCTGSSQEWSLTTNYYGGPFQPGRAFVRANVNAYGANYEFRQTAKNVSIR